MKNIDSPLGAVCLRPWNIFQYNAKIHTDIICALPITVHMMRSYLNLESVRFQSGLQQSFEISIWFENLELMAMLLSIRLREFNLCFTLPIQDHSWVFLIKKNISNGIEISNRFDFRSSLMQTASKFIFFAPAVLCVLGMYIRYCRF